MKPLSPKAQALLDSASAQEPSPSPEVLGRMRASVLRKAALVGGTVVLGSSATAKAGVLGSSLLSQALVFGLGGAIVGLGTAALVTRAPSTIEPHVTMAAAPRPAPRSPGKLPFGPTNLPAPIETEEAPPAMERPGAAPEGSSVPLAMETEAIPAPNTPAAMVTSVASAPVTVVVRKDPPESSASIPLARLTPLAPLASAALPAIARPNPASPDAARGFRPPDEPMAGVANPPSAPPPPSPNLSVQLEILRRAHALLRAADSARALHLLEGQAHLFDDSPLEEEMRTARIAALCHLGHHAQARSEIDAFVKRWPNSPHVRQIERGCSAE